MTKKAVYIITAVFILLVLLYGVVIYVQKNSTNTKVPASLYPGKIVIGYTQWPGDLGLFIANEKGYFKDAGLNVEIKNYISLGDLYKDYVDNKVQGSANVTLDSVSEAYGGLDHKIVMVTDYSNGADGIIASNKIKTFADIKGKKVAFEYGTLEEFFLKYALEKNNIKFSDIIPVNLDGEKSAEAVSSGQADVGVTFEPFMSQAILKGGSYKIYSSANAPGLITDALTFHTDFINQNPDTIEAIVRACLKGVQFWKDNNEEANTIIAKYLGIIPEEVPAQIAGVTILDDRDNLTAFTFSSGLQSLYGNMRSTGQFVQSNEASSTKMIDTDTLIDPSFIRAISQ